MSFIQTTRTTFDGDDIKGLDMLEEQVRRLALTMH